MKVKEFTYYQRIPVWKDIHPENWMDWHWQMKESIRTVSRLNKIIGSFTDLKVEESEELDYISKELFSFKVTPHMIFNLMKALESNIEGAWTSFNQAFIPGARELLRGIEQGIDCIGEELPNLSPVPSITNFYKNRVLFRVTNMCPAYCRYCFRRRMVGDGRGAWNEESINAGLKYIAGNSEIREVIISGGDPLILSDEKIEFLLKSLKSIEHVKRLRIDSKALTMIPQRLTPDLVRIFSEYQPFYFIGHFSHPMELSDETKFACAMLSDAGIPLGSHTPLMKGINDNDETLKALMEGLVDSRVQPYYLIHFIPTKWTEHFRVPLQSGINLIENLFRDCGGLATPTLIVYLPNGGGKVPVLPNHILDKNKEGYLFKSMNGKTILYPEPEETEN